MLRPAYVLVFLWAIGLALFWYLRGPKEIPPPDNWLATRAMPRNSQVRDGDVRGPKERYLLARMPRKELLIGRHLKTAKKEGDHITLQDTIPQPIFDRCEPGSGVLLYSLKNEEWLTDGMEIGSWVIPCFLRPGKSANEPLTTKCAKTSLEIEAVHRPTSATDWTWVGLRVPSCRQSDIGEYLGREKHFLLLAANPAPSSHHACPR